MEKQQTTAVLIMDLSADFDTVDHDFLLSVLQRKFGITKIALEWYNNFLKPWNSKYYQWLILVRMDHGLWPTQGSTWGVYLFNCYASTLAEIVPDMLTLNDFADDHLIRRTFKPEKTSTNKDNKSPSEDDTIAISERSMQDIKAWMEAVKVKLSKVKTELIYFGSRQQLNKTT